MITLKTLLNLLLMTTVFVDSQLTTGDTEEFEEVSTSLPPPITETPSTNVSEHVLTPMDVNPTIRGSSFETCGIRGPPSRLVTKEVSDIINQDANTNEDETETHTETFEEETTEIVTKAIERHSQKDALNINPRILTDEEGREIQDPLSDDSTVSEIDSDAAITTLEWNVPTLKDTLFAQYTANAAPSPFEPRITYGQVAGTREFPWQVAMVVRGRFHCGASLISSTHVLTAAHCVTPYETSLSLLQLSLGDWDLKKSKDGKSLKVKASSAHVHPDFSLVTLQNDIAVLKLNQEVAFNDRIRPICLPDSDIDIKGAEAIVSGWGRNEAYKLQSKLHHLTAKILPNSQCDRRWNLSGAPTGFIVSSMMCMDATSGDSCNGDSGGPSIYEYPSGSGHYVQVGIVSFGSGSCTNANLPGVYTRISYYIDWIRQQMN